MSCHAIDDKNATYFINAVLQRNEASHLLFINDNVQFTSNEVLSNLCEMMRKYRIKAISPVKKTNNYLSANKLGNGQIFGHGIIADTRFDTRNIPYATDLLQEDCFLISQDVWQKVNGFSAIANTFYRVSQLSANLAKNKITSYVMPVDGFVVKGIASSWQVKAQVSLTQERQKLLQENPDFYLNSSHYSKAFDSRTTMQLDLAFGTSKTPKLSLNSFSFS